jgi:predicted phage tail component-like protein
MAYNIKFNGFDLNSVIKITNVKRPVMPERETKLIEIPNKDGGQLQHVRYKPKKIDFDFIVFGSNNTQVRNNVRTLASILNQREEKEVIFSDEPQLTYEGTVDGSTDYDQIALMGKGTITLIFPDPHGYEAERTITATGPTVIIDNDANADLFPVVTAKFKKTATFFSLADPQGNVVLIGNPDDPTKVQVNPIERVLWDQFDNLSAWQAGSFSQIDGLAQGTMKSNGFSFSIDSWGPTQPNGTWYGPTMKRSLATPLNDYLIDFQINFNTDVAKVGRIELYLLDVNNAVIGKLQLVDAYPNYREPSARVIGGNPKVNPHLTLIDAWTGNWTTFSGLLRIEKQGHTFKAWVTETVNGVYEEGIRGKTPVYWSDDTTGALASVIVHIGGMDPYGAPSMSIEDLKIYKLNDVQSGQQPQIFQVNDTVEIDFFNGKVFKNGEYWMKYLDAGSKFFPIPAGQTEVAFFPSDLAAADITVKYKKRWI